MTQIGIDTIGNIHYCLTCTNFGLKKQLFASKIICSLSDFFRNLRKKQDLKMFFSNWPQNHDDCFKDFGFVKRGEKIFHFFRSIADMPQSVETRFRELATQFGLDYDAMCVSDNSQCKWWFQKGCVIFVPKLPFRFRQIKKFQIKTKVFISR